MAHLACPCGNSLSNSCDGDETEYYFVENGVIEAHQDDFAFFELEYNDLSTEIWKCDVCDRMMFFDGPSARVSRYMRRIDAESLGKDELAREHKSGICFNNLLFNEVDWFFRRRQSRQPPASSSARASSFSGPVGLPPEGTQIDLIASDEDTLVFIDVTATEYGESGFEGGKVKRSDLEIAAAAWLAGNSPNGEIQVRFDIIDMLVVSADRALLRHHITALSCGVE